MKNQPIPIINGTTEEGTWKLMTMWDDQKTRGESVTLYKTIFETTTGKKIMSEHAH